MRHERPWQIAQQQRLTGPLATGVHGRIVLHEYWPAADVEGYVVDRHPDGRTFVRAQLRHADDYKLARAPLTFVITMRRGEWHFPVLNVVSYREHTFTAQVGEPRAVRREGS